MGTRTKIDHGSAQWWVLDFIRRFGPTSRDYLTIVGTHETEDAIRQLFKLSMLTRDHDKNIEMTSKGRESLIAANKAAQRVNLGDYAKPRSTPIRKELYEGRELLPYDGRPGAMDAFTLPSLQHGRRVDYRTGEVLA